MSQKTIAVDLSTVNGNICEEISGIQRQTGVIRSEGRSDLVSSSSITTRLEECFSCTLCSRMFKNKRGLNQHLRFCRNKVLESNLNRELISNRLVYHDSFSSVLESNSTGNSTVNSIDQASIQSNAAQAPPDAVLLEELLIWGLLSLSDICQIINSIYEEVVFWKRNLFMLPSGKVGKEFVEECSRLINEWVDDGPLRLVALKALMIMPSLLLQKPTKSSKTKDHVDNLRRRLNLWRSGSFDELVREARFTQSKFSQHRRADNIEQMAKKFNGFIIKGKINAALKLLSDVRSNDVLHLDDQTLRLLREKHPDSGEKFENLLLRGPELSIGEYAFECIDAFQIYKSAKDVKGTAGPSSLDVDGWRRILTSAAFGTKGHNLCDSFETLLRR